MKSKINLIVIVVILLTIGLACEFSTANLAEITFARDEANTKKIESAKIGEKIYVHSAIKNASGEHLVRWKVSDSNGKEIELPQDEIMIKGARSIWLTLNLNPRAIQAGEYKFEVRLLNQKGDEEFAKKTATLEIK